MYIQCHPQVWHMAELSVLPTISHSVFECIIYFKFAKNYVTNLPKVQKPGEGQWVLSSM